MGPRIADPRSCRQRRMTRRPHPKFPWNVPKLPMLTTRCVASRRRLAVWSEWLEQQQNHGHAGPVMLLRNVRVRRNPESNPLAMSGRSAHTSPTGFGTCAATASYKGWVRSPTPETMKPDNVHIFSTHHHNHNELQHSTQTHKHKYIHNPDPNK